ncbi:MAG: hypothetical protein ACYTFW_05205 [Planctomycetota bacterium]
MDQVNDVQALVSEFTRAVVLFLPVLFGGVEFIKSKLGLSGKVVELISVGLFVVFGGLIVLSHYYPARGAEITAIVLFLSMCALAPSGFYKFVNARAAKIE